MKIFISYRRDDSADATGRLYDRLEQHYGPNDVFMDVDAIPLGVDFRKHLGDAVSQCDVLLAIIGERWFGASDSGERRIDDPRDFVRIEVESALARNIPVVPVLVGTASMPSERDLPDSLKELAFRNAAELRSGRYFRPQLDHLIRGLERLSQATVASGLPDQPQQKTAPQEDGQSPASGVATVEIDAGTSEVYCPVCQSAVMVGPTEVGRQMRCPFCLTEFLPIAPAPKCPACGADRLSGAIACMDCGALFDTEALGDETNTTGNLCTNPSCGIANPPDARYCLRCGLRLPNPAGSIIDDRYRVEQLLAMGGFGSIYLAADTKGEDAPVVVKEMLCSDANDFSLRLSFFRREAEILRLLSGVTAVPRLYAFIEQGHDAYLVMEYVEGKDLLRILEENHGQPFSLDQVVEWGVEVCDVLKLMHGLNPPWVHRDLKPENVLLKNDGTVKLIDFGAARSLGFRDKAGRIERKADKKTRVYTDGYAPPEQIVGKPEPRSDIFAMAAMLYHLATGKSPEGFYTARELEEQLNNRTLPAEDRWFYELIMINLAEDANDRYYAASWFKTDLQRRKLSRGILCKSCKKVNKLRTPYCVDCNAPLTPKLPPCTQCGTINRMGSRVCTQCQNRLR